jgi:hypothetical protein
MNEPHPGFIGMPDISILDSRKDLRLSCSPLPIEAFALGCGHTVDVDFYKKSWPVPSKRAGKRTLNKKKLSAWISGRPCIWKQEGVWEDLNGKATLLKPHHFKYRPDGTLVDFRQHYYAPFLKKFCAAIREGNPEFAFLFEPVPNEEPPRLIQETPNWHASNTIYAPHWYDLASVFTKSFTGRFTHDIQGLSKVI